MPTSPAAEGDPGTDDGAVDPGAGSDEGADEVLAAEDRVPCRLVEVQAASAHETVATVIVSARLTS